MNEEEQLEQALIYRKQGNYDEAVDIYENMLQHGYASFHVYMGYGKALYFQYDDLEKSAQMFEKALEIRPHDEESMLCQAMLYNIGYGKGYKEAGVVYQAIYEQNPMCIAAYEGMAMNYGCPGVVMEKHDYITYLSIVVEWLPNNIQAKLNLVSGYLIIRKPEISLEILNDIKKSMDKNDRYYQYVIKKIDYINNSTEMVLMPFVWSVCAITNT